MNPSVSYIGLFVEGLASFFSPCVLPLIPLYMGYLSAGFDAQADPRAARRGTFLRTLFFVLGIGTVFALAALGLAAMHDFLTAHALQFQLAGGVLLILAGLAVFGVIKVPFLERTYSVQRKNGTMNNLEAYLMGFFFSFAWSPCIGPMMASALVASANAATRGQSVAMIAAYGAGFLIMFLLLGLFTDAVLGFLKKHQGFMKVMPKIGGAVILAMGVYMLAGADRQLNALLTSSSGSAAAASSASAASTSGSTEQADASPSPSATADTRPDIEKYDFTLDSSLGHEVSLSDYEGKTVVLNFFATWCTYCNQEMPDLQEAYETREDVVVLLVAMPGLNNEGDEEYIVRYMNSLDYTMPVLYDTTGEVNLMYGVQGFPTTFIFRPDGSLLGYSPGYMDAETLNAALDQAASASGEAE